MLSHFDCRVLLAREVFSEAALPLYHAEKPRDEASGVSSQLLFT
jgi:hypothetical protein